MGTRFMPKCDLQIRRFEFDHNNNAPLICPNCKKEMRLDDKDFNFKGNFDNYWICDNCKTAAFEKVRYNMVCSIEISEVEK